MSPRFVWDPDDDDVRTFPAIVTIPVRGRSNQQPAKHSQKAKESPPRKVWQPLTVQLDPRDPSQCFILGNHSNWHHKVKTPQRLVPDLHLVNLLTELCAKEKYKNISIDPYNPKRRKDNDPLKTKDYYSE